MTKKKKESKTMDTYLKAVKQSKSFNHWQEWAINEVRVRVIDGKTAYIDYEKYMVNAPRNRIVITVNWLDRRKGITLEDKVRVKLLKLKNKLERENEQIVAQKKLEKKLNN